MKFTGNPFGGTFAYDNGARFVRNSVEVAAVLVVIDMLNGLLEAVGHEAINYRVANWDQYVPKYRGKATYVRLLDGKGDDLGASEAAAAQKILLRLAAHVTRKEASVRITQETISLHLLFGTNGKCVSP